MPTDSTWLYVLMCGPAGARFRYRGRTPSPETVQADLWNGVYAQFVVTTRAGRPVGLVGLTNMALDAGRAHAFAVGEPDASPLVAEGFGLLCQWGFEHLQLHRVFLEIAEFNAANIASLGDAAVVEGRLRNYELWQGRYWDHLIVSITREAFDRRCGALIDARQRIDPNEAHLDLAELVDELWPLDSLGWIELANAVEESTGILVDDTELYRLDASDSKTMTTELFAWISDHTPGQQSGDARSIRSR